MAKMTVSVVILFLLSALLAAVCATDLEVQVSTVPICTPPCKTGEVICTWDSGGNGFNGSTSCQRACGAPVGSGAACKMSANNTCWWGWTKEAGWACFSGPPPCSPDKDVIGSAYLTCAEFQRDYGGCEGQSGHECDICCSKKCHCVDLIEDKSECQCGAG